MDRVPSDATSTTITIGLVDALRLYHGLHPKRSSMGACLVRQSMTTTHAVRADARLPSKSGIIRRLPWKPPNSVQCSSRNRDRDRRPGIQIMPPTWYGVTCFNGRWLLIKVFQRPAKSIILEWKIARPGRDSCLRVNSMMQEGIVSTSRLNLYREAHKSRMARNSPHYSISKAFDISIQRTCSYNISCLLNMHSTLLTSCRKTCWRRKS